MNPDLGQGFVHDFDCTHDPCRCGVAEHPTDPPTTDCPGCRWPESGVMEHTVFGEPVGVPSCSTCGDRKQVLVGPLTWDWSPCPICAGPSDATTTETP